MKKGKQLLCAALVASIAVGSIVAFAGCNDPKEEKKPLTDKTLTVTKIADYTKTAEDRKETFPSGSKGYSWENGEPFNVWWKAENVSYDGGKMSLSLSEMTTKEQKWDEESQQNVDCMADYYGAEERSEHYYGYGDFTVRMKPAKIVGTASTFFTCTGPYDKWYEEDGVTVKKTNDHDEIDIEFLGKDTTKVQFNYFASGVGGHEYMYDLGFDASLEYHDYGFRWAEEYITWFVDGKPVYRVDRADAKEGEEWPEDPGRIIMNYWCATEEASGWMGEFADDYSGRAVYEYVGATGEAQPDPNTAHIKDTPSGEVTVPTEGWTDIDYSAFDGWGNYTVDKTDGLTISHDEAKSGYACCGASLEKSYSWVKFKVKNNAESEADIRLDLKKETPSTGGAEAVVSKDDKATVIASNSAVGLKLAAGEELEVAVKIKDSVNINQMVVFLNSMQSGSPTVGSITISELKGIEKEVNPDEPTPPAGDTVKIGENEVTFAGNGYTVTPSDDKSSMSVSYTDISGKGYNNILTDISSFVGNNNTFTVKIENKGAAEAKIRLDIGCDAADGSTQQDGTTKNTFCNISAEYEGTVAGQGNDYAYGGADWVKIAAGETVTAKITFTANVAKKIIIFIDSSTYDDETTHTGEAVFSEMAFSVTQPSEPDTPEIPEGDGKTLAFSSTESYTVDKSGEEAAKITVTYSDVSGASYANISANAATLAADNNTFSVKVTNNSERAIKIRIDLIGEQKVTVGDNANMECCNLSATASKDVGIYTDTTWGGTTFTVAAGDCVTVTVTYSNANAMGAVQRIQLYMDSFTESDRDNDVHYTNGSVTFEEFKFACVEE